MLRGIISNGAIQLNSSFFNENQEELVITNFDHENYISYGTFEFTVNPKTQDFFSYTVFTLRVTSEKLLKTGHLQI